MTQTFNEKVVVNESVEINGSDGDAVQLRVEGAQGQAQPLQVWQTNGDDVLAQMTADGRLQIGDQGVSTPDALIEASKTVTPSDLQRGLNTHGQIDVDGPLSESASWSVHELELTGEGLEAVSGVHTALRAKLTYDNNGGATEAELRAGDFEAINQQGDSQAPVGQMTGLRGTASNGPGAYLDKAVGVEASISNETSGDMTEAAAFEVAAPINSGTIDTLYGLRIPDLTQGMTNVAIQTGQGVVRVGDHEELKVLANAPTANPPTNFIKVYPKLYDGVPTLYAKDSAGVEHSLIGSGGSGTSIGTALDVTTDEFEMRSVLYDNTLAATGIFDVSNIDQSYDHLELVMSLRGTVANSNQSIHIHFNNDATNSNYFMAEHYAGASHGSDYSALPLIGWVAAGTSPSGYWDTVKANISFYAGNQYKNVLSHCPSSELAGTFYLETLGVQWRNTAAINRIAIVSGAGEGAWAAGSRLQIIGIKKQTIVTGATGGTPLHVESEKMETRTELYNVTLSTAGSFDVQGISQNYDHLEIEFWARGANSAAADSALMAVNGDTTGSHYFRRLMGTVSTGTPSVDQQNDYFLAALPAAGSTAGFWLSTTVKVMHYTSGQHKTFLGRHSIRRSDSTAQEYDTTLHYEQALPVTRLTFTTSTGSQFAAGSHLRIVGIKSQSVVTNVTGNIAPLQVTTDEFEMRSVLYDSTLEVNGAFDVQNIDQSYDQLELVLKARTTASAASESVIIQFNGDTTAANYNRERLSGSSTIPGAGGADDSQIGYGVGNTMTGNYYGMIIATIPSYANTTIYKMVRSNYVARFATTNGTETGDFAVNWESQAAINRIAIKPAGATLLTAGSRLQIIGVKKRKVVTGATGGTPLQVTKKTMKTRTTLYDNTLAENGSWDVQNISQEYDDLEFEFDGAAYSPNANDSNGLYVTFNNDSTMSNYRQVGIWGQTYTHSQSGGANNQFGWVCAVPGGTDSWTRTSVRISQYRDAKHKIATGLTNLRDSAVSAYTGNFVVYWFNTSAINRIAIAAYTGTVFVAGSRLRIIGIKEEEVVTDVSGASVTAPSEYILIQEQYPSTNSVAASSAGWQSRNLNTIVDDVRGYATLASRQITLAPGTYRVRARCPVSYIGTHQARLWDVTNGKRVILGSSEYAADWGGHGSFSTASWLEGRIVVNSPTAFELQQYAEGASNTGFGYGGVATGSGAFVYASIEFWREPEIAMYAPPSVCEGRLTLESGVPVSTTDQTAKTTVYFAPYKGNRISLYNGREWVVAPFTEKSVSLSSCAADTNYDVFMVSGTQALELAVWTNATTRATALVLQDGVYCKSGELTRRYLGTIRTTSTAGQCEDSKTKRFVWNEAEPVDRFLYWLPTTPTSVTINSASWIYYNGDSANSVSLVIGTPSRMLDARGNVISYPSSSSGIGAAIGLDGSVAGQATPGSYVNSGGVGIMIPLSAFYTDYIAVGYHTIQVLMKSSNSTVVFGNQSDCQSSLNVVIKM